MIGKHDIIRILGLLAALMILIPVTSIVFSQEYNTIGKRVIVAKIEGVIDPAIEELVKNVIRQAEETNSLVILELNTPGGLLDSALNIAIAIDNSDVPVIGYVVEKWAESAGTLILVTTHIAVMQPGTIIGSMQPIQYDPTTGGYQPVNESKIINPILEFLDEHAGNKGRNITAIKRFVTENLNLGAYDALKMNVIDYVAKDINDLLLQIDGKTIELPLTGKKYILDTDGAIVERYSPELRIRIAHALSDPLLTSLFMTLGLTIILFSIISGNFVATPIGVLLLLLGLIGSGYNLNLTSMFLLLIGAILLGVELFVTPGFGVLGITGIIMLAIGIALLPASTGYSFSREYAQNFVYAAYGIGGILGIFTGVTVYKVLQARKRKPFSWDIAGKTGKAVDDIEPGKEGFVIVDGEYWRAISIKPIKSGETIKVVKKEGPILVVERIEEQ